MMRFLGLMLAMLALVGACGGDPTLSLPERIDPVWPPEEGAYCGDARDVCGDDGTPWVCGPRPLWEPVDCEAFCAEVGGEHHGCHIIDAGSRHALGLMKLPGGSGTAVFAPEVPSARCLCTPPEAIECAGPGHWGCSDRQRLWVCDDTLQWRREECAEQCASLRPPLAAIQCESGRSPRSIGRGGACACTAVGTPCAREGEYHCDGRNAMGCVDGHYKILYDCWDQVSCPEQGIACSPQPEGEPLCHCVS